LFVAQDGHNDGGNQNFKLVRWGLAPLVVEPGR
jgi:myo-inositol-hexaphosphate 3-phosphohydrolase